MAICPVCKKEIDYLKFEAEVQHFGDFRAEEGGYENWDSREEGDWNNIIFLCPECNTELSYNSEKAREFLENKDELKRMIENKIKK